MWKTVKLGDVCDVLDSLRKPITKKFRSQGEYPYYGATGIVDWVDNYIFDEKLVLVGEDGAKWGAGDKTAFIAEGKYWVNNHAHVLRPHLKTITHEWIAYYLTAIDLKEWVTGLTVPKLNQAQLRSIPIPLPPLAEQQRIVEKLDRAFEEIDRAIEATEERRKVFPSLTQQVISSVISKFSSNTITKSIGEILKLSSGAFLPAKAMNSDGEINVYGGNGIAGRHDNFNLSGPNILVGRVGAKCGNVHYVNENIWLTDNAMYVHSLSREIDLQFLTMILKSLNLGQYARQAAQPVISYSAIKDVDITLPESVEEQKEIVNLLNQLHDEVEHFRDITTEKIYQLIRLKSAILAQELKGPAK